MDVAACMYHTGLDPMTKKPVYVAKYLRDRKVQRALMQFFKPENYFLVRKALLQAGRRDLIGDGCDCLIPSKPPKSATEARRQRAQREASRRPDVERTTGGPRDRRIRRSRPAPTTGYRPGRKGAKGR
jgi:hypothetical protein